MEITQAQFEQIAHCLPTQRGNVSLSNLSVLNAVLYVAEHGCKWRGLPMRISDPVCNKSGTVHTQNGYVEQAGGLGATQHKIYSRK